MDKQKINLIRHAVQMAEETGSDRVMLFLNTNKDLADFKELQLENKNLIAIVLPRGMKENSDVDISGIKTVKSWSGNQSRFSRVKYAFLNAVIDGIITPESRVICVLGPSGKDHLDTITVHDLSLSWSEDFPFAVDSLFNNKSFFTVMAVLDIALDIGALGREGKSVGTIFVIGDTENVMNYSHQGIFNPFHRYPKKERNISLPEVVESIKELAKIDGATLINTDGCVEASGRILDVKNITSKGFQGLGSRHRAGAAITQVTDAVSIVVSESTGRVTIFEKGKVITNLEPLINRRLV